VFWGSGSAGARNSPFHPVNIEVEIMQIIIDSREQLPYQFDRWPVSVTTASLTTGDYSIQGFQDKAAIERKSLDDLVGCLTGKGRTRFEKELSRARSLELFVVVVEADFCQIAGKRYYSAMNPESVLQSVAAFHIRYNTPFLFCGDRAGAEYITHSLLHKYVQEIRKRFTIYEKWISEQTAHK